MRCLWSDGRTRRRVRAAVPLLLLAAVLAVGVSSVLGGTSSDDGGGAPRQGRTEGASQPSVSAGGTHSCGVKADGTIACWGDNAFGQSDAPAGAFVQVSAGGNHSCGVKDDGTLTCWGENSGGQLNGIPDGAFTQVSAGVSHSCGVRDDGSIACWGDNSRGQLNDVPTGAFAQVSAGDTHSCAARADGTVACWGANFAGQLDAPTDTFVQVSAGGSYSCGVRADGTLACWGSNAQRQLDDVPTGAFVQVSAGELHACGLRVGGTVACWGSSEFQQLDGLPTSGVLTQVSAGGAHTCGVEADGSAVCWGNDANGQWDVPEASFVRPGVAAGHSFTCGVTSDGTVSCWGGENLFGELDAPAAGGFTQVSAGGDTAIVDGAHACAVGADGTVACWGVAPEGLDVPPGAFVQVSTGRLHSCGVRVDGTIACWGDTSRGQSDAIPTGAFVQVSAGGDHSCGVRDNGSLACWGFPEHPVVQDVPTGAFLQVAVGAAHACAVKDDRSIVCWGFLGQTSPPQGAFTEVSAGFDYNCGLRVDGTIACWGTFAPIPVALINGVPTGRFMEVSAGDFHVCGVRVNGTVACSGADGALVNGSLPAPSPAPPASIGGAAFSHVFTSGVGAPAGVFSVTAGALPDGLTLSPAGAISGTPTASGSFTFTVSVSSLLGTESAEFTIEVAPDAVGPVAAPSLSPAANGAGWNKGDVTVGWNWADEPAGSGIDPANCTVSSVSSGEGGALELSASCKDRAGNTGSASRTVKVDRTPPSVSCGTSPSFVLGGSHAANVTASVTDGLSRPLASSLSVDVTAADVASVGVRSKSVTGEDAAGNTTTVSCPYTVGYRVLSLLPVGGSTYRPGGVVPVAFGLGSASGALIPNAEARSLVSPCRIKVALDGVDLPGCAVYASLLRTFGFAFTLPRNVAAGAHVVRMRVSAADGSGVVSEASTTIRVR